MTAPGRRQSGRQLSVEEAALWAQVAKTVTPIPGRRPPRIDPPAALAPQSTNPSPPAKQAKRRPVAASTPPPVAAPTPAKPPPSLDRQSLDAAWDRRLARGLVPPDFTLDLHGASLDAAHGRLEHGLTLAAAQDARLVLLITGKHRPHGDHASRGDRRGAIRAKFLDWLQAGPHASRIAAIRPAHPRHGGAGAVYIVLRRKR